MEREGGEGSASKISGNNTDSLAWIFLSHSGRQKPFAKSLYRALLRAKHRPFFDEDTIVSLPTCSDYPSRIFQACAPCKMGVVVLSKGYVESLWPMVELQHLLQNTTCKIYPVFYDLQPSDLSAAENLARWEECWAEQAAKWQWEHRMQEVQDFMQSRGCNIHINLDRSTWAGNLKKLHYISGEVCQKVTHINDERTLYHRSEHEIIQALVSNICSLQPPPYPMDEALKLISGQRMHQVIAGVFDQKESLGVDGVRAVGVHGIGGCGKTMLCKVMAAFYNDKFGGRCCHLELPTNDNEVGKLLGNIKAILPALVLHSASTKDIESINIDEAMNLLEEGLQRTKVFLAMDNVWGHSRSQHLSFEYAQRTMLMKFMPGSKILVTGQSKEVLRGLLQRRLESVDSYMQDGNVINAERSMTTPSPMVVHIPSLTELEAVKVLKLYNPFSCCNIPDEDEWLSLARTCFFGGQCRPLCLKLKGGELQRRGRPWFNDEKCRALFLSLKNEWHAPNSTEEDQVWSVVERSFNVLPFRLQGTFIDLATASHYIRKLCDSTRGVNLWNVLAYTAELRSDQNVYTADDIFGQVLELEYHGLLELKYHDDLEYHLDGDEEIHDLHRMLAEAKVSQPPHSSNALINHAVVGDLSRVPSLEILASKELVIYGDGRIKANTLANLTGGSNEFSSTLERPTARTQVLCLRSDDSGFESGTKMEALRVSLESGRLKALRVLLLRGIRGLTELDGWEGVPELVRLELDWLPDLRRIGVLGCLSTRLETLIIDRCENLEVQVLVGDDHNDKEKKRSSLVKVGDHFPKLQALVCVTIVTCWSWGPHSLTHSLP